MAENEFTPNGKIMCYLNNWDGEKNNFGTDSKPTLTMLQNYDWSSVEDGENVQRKGYSDGNNDTQAFWGHIERLEMLLCFDHVNKWDEPYPSKDYGNLAVISEGCYNREQIEVSYENPIIFHYTKTYQNTEEQNKVIYGFVVYSNVKYEWYGSNWRRKKIVCKEFDEPVTIAPGDKFTITVTVK